MCLTCTTVMAQPNAAPTITFLARSYHLGSYNQQPNPMWEFVSGNETVETWTTLLTLIDRPEARTLAELDRLAEGVKSTYQSHGGKVLMAKTMQDANGTKYDYTVVAFDEPAKHRYELNFVKAALGPKNAYIAVFGAWVSDPKDYVAKAKAFLNEHSDEIGKALEKTAFPEMSKLPRKPF